MSDPFDLKQFIRTVEDFPIPGIKFRDITSLIETPIAFVKTCEELNKITEDFKATKIASIESRGFIFAGSIAHDLALPFILARKPGKLPNETYKKEFDLEYGSTSIEIQTNTTIEKEDRIAIVDDLVATGGSVMATKQLIEQTGATVLGASTLIDLAYVRDEQPLDLNTVSIMRVPPHKEYDGPDYP